MINFINNPESYLTFIIYYCCFVQFFDCLLFDKTFHLNSNLLFLGRNFAVDMLEWHGRLYLIRSERESRKRGLNRLETIESRPDKSN